MDKFIEKWRSDKKYRAKIKLLLYCTFFIVVSLYAISISRIQENRATIVDAPTDTNEVVFLVPDKYHYTTDIVIDDATYQYSGDKLADKLTITKTVNDDVTEYVYENNEYYVLDNDIYVKTTKDEVYDIVNYNYLNLETINEYLSKATANNNQYLVYLKDIILGNDSEDYFVILINDKTIDIDYTPLMKQFNSKINNYKVTIKIEVIE